MACSQLNSAQHNYTLSSKENKCMDSSAWMACTDCDSQLDGLLPTGVFLVQYKSPILLFGCWREGGEVSRLIPPYKANLTTSRLLLPAG